MRRIRWHLALRASALVMAVLAVLSAGAYLVARGVLYGRLHETLERAARAGQFRPNSEREPFVVVGGPGTPIPRGLDAGDTDGFALASDARYGTLAVLRWRTSAGALRFLALPAVDDVQALGTFLAILAGLTLSGGLVAFPAGYLLAGRALRPLDDAVRERAEFVALASHRLRTPLSVIRTSAELALVRQGLDAPEALRTIVQQTGEMESLAARLTALARAEAHPGEHRPVADLAAVVGEVALAFHPAAAQAGVELQLQVAGAVPVDASAEDARDALASVLENAIRFSPAGSAVTVRVGRAGRWGTVEVCDQGPGIDPADLPRVTRPFYQGRRARGSTGLGLAVARAIVDRRDGHLEISSLPERGTRVRIALPAPRRGRRRA